MKDPKQIEVINQFLTTLSEAGFLITTTGAAAIPIHTDILQELVEQSLLKSKANIYTFKEASQSQGEFVRIYEDGGVSAMVLVPDGLTLKYKGSGLKVSTPFGDEKYQKIS